MSESCKEDCVVCCLGVMSNVFNVMVQDEPRLEIQERDFSLSETDNSKQDRSGD